MPKIKIEEIIEDERKMISKKVNNMKHQITIINQEFYI